MEPSSACYYWGGAVTSFVCHFRYIASVCLHPTNTTELLKGPDECLKERKIVLYRSCSVYHIASWFLGVPNGRELG